MPRPGQIPLTIVTGSLGAGKSTVLQHVLTANHGLRIAVVLNEFGETGELERKAMSFSDGGGAAGPSSELVELANGCWCCTVNDSGRSALERLMTQRGQFDYILLETTGLADPSPIARGLFQLEDELSSIVLDGIVTVVDGLNVLDQLSEAAQPDRGDEIVRQIAFADCLVVSKQDLAAKPFDEVERALRTLNSAAPILRASKGAVPLDRLLHLGAFSTTARPVLEASPNPSHLRGISALTIPLPTLVEPAPDGRFDELLRTLLWDGQLAGWSAPLEIARCKGYAVDAAGQTYVVQGVRDVYTTDPTPPLDVAPALVLIGRGLSDGVRDAFLAALRAP